ncbi:hypothetical protein [Methanoregula sp.]|uniref:hypothetical protein n=1 Tax=Methanoregula sp. TaxID=2052170 RepID=UPI003C72C40B
MRPGPHPDRKPETGVANLIEYVMVTGVLMALFIVMLLLVNTNIMANPADTLSYYAFTDIGNGVSTSIVDVYILAPQNGTISTKFSIPPDVAEQSYSVDIEPSADQNDQDVIVWRDTISSNISLSGIMLTTHGAVIGNTTSGGINTISYDSGGF